MIIVLVLQVFGNKLEDRRDGGKTRGRETVIRQGTKEIRTKVSLALHPTHLRAPVNLFPWQQDVKRQVQGGKIVCSHRVAFVSCCIILLGEISCWANHFIFDGSHLASIKQGSVSSESSAHLATKLYRLSRGGGCMRPVTLVQAVLCPSLVPERVKIRKHDRLYFV